MDNLALGDHRHHRRGTGKIDPQRRFAAHGKGFVQQPKVLCAAFVAVRGFDRDTGLVKRGNAFADVVLIGGVNEHANAIVILAKGLVPERKVLDGNAGDRAFDLERQHLPDFAFVREREVQRAVTHRVRSDGQVRLAAREFAFF